MSDPPTLSFCLTLPSDPVSVAMARAVVRVLRTHVDTGPLTSLELVMSEIVTNSVRYGAGESIRVELSLLHDELECRVSDRGAAFGVPAEPRGDGATSGFGLRIAADLSSQFSVERVDGTNTVAFSFPRVEARAQ